MSARTPLLLVVALVMSACGLVGYRGAAAPITVPPSASASPSVTAAEPAPETADDLGGPHTGAYVAGCFGADALAAPTGACPRSTRSGRLTPKPAVARRDKSRAYGYISGGKHCFADLPRFPVTTCTFGDPRATTSVALIGNSHAGQWLPAIERIAAKKHWRVTTYLASQCALADVRQGFDTPQISSNCQRWGREVTDRVARGGFDLVILTNKISRGVRGQTLAASTRLFQQGYARVLERLQRAQLRVVGVRDTPSPAIDVPGCLAAHPKNYHACSGTRATWLPPEPLTAAVAGMRDERITMIDMSDYICESTLCSAAVGGVPVYFDVSHLTATYARTLTPYLAYELEAGLER